MQTKKKKFSIHFIKDSEGDYSVNIMTLGLKIIAVLFLILFLTASIIFMVNSFIFSRHLDSQNLTAEFCDTLYVKGDYNNLSSALEHKETASDEYDIYREIIAARKVMLEADAFKSYDESRYKEKLSELEQLCDDTRFSRNKAVMEKWIEQLKQME